MGSKSPIAFETGNQVKPQIQAEREDLMTKIYQMGFYLDDLTLYLDTHENDVQAIQLYHQKAKEYAELRKQFAQKYYPLSRLCIPYCNENAFCWQEGPMPWEGACV
jgi:Cft2 family RNA processing exonuclease